MGRIHDERAGSWPMIERPLFQADAVGIECNTLGSAGVLQNSPLISQSVS
jgi:hypothetical protein